MTQPPDFDPFELLGVEIGADAATVDRAYKARIRYVHPDIAGTAGLNETKRLNVAREWLLDPDLRAQLPAPKARPWQRRQRPAAEPPPQPPPPPPRWSEEPPVQRKPAWEYDPLEDDPLTFDYGSHADRIHAFFGPSGRSGR